mmetsp:Transcript_30203/g.68196  ORF Transcript_30203/g.68196 Transcript_30203/m.68196 type:complete len:97 (+) Transcript_30203:526-816(+)
MPFSSDGLPMVGECAALGFGGLWLACGFGPTGIMEGPAAAALLAERLVVRLQGGAMAPTRPGMGRACAALSEEEEDKRVVLQTMNPCRQGCVHLAG